MINTDILPTDIPVETPINNPTDFPIGSRINVINHLKYGDGGKHGIVRGHQQHDQSNTNSPKISPAPHQFHPNLHPTMQLHACSPTIKHAKSNEE